MSGGKSRRRASAATELDFSLRPRAPFRLDLTVWALMRRAHNAVDLWDGKCYRRLFAVPGGAALLRVTQHGPPERPLLRIDVQGGRRGSSDGLRGAAVSLVEKTLGVREDLEGFYAMARGDSRLWPLARAFAGLKPPRFPTVFEAVINAVACQQLSLDVGITLLNRLAGRYGASFSYMGRTFHAFPRPEDLAGLEGGHFRELGFSIQKGRAIAVISREVAEGAVDLEALHRADDEAAFMGLVSLRGIGRWSAEYVLLRGLGRLSVLPADDTGAKRSIRTLLALRHSPDYKALKRVTARWSPYAGFVYFHLLLKGLRERGCVS
jgi:DNA-3-methyladenine glycosylase II